MTERVPYRATDLAIPYDAIRKLPVEVLLDNVRSAYNVGAFFRSADAVGVSTRLRSPAVAASYGVASP